MEETRNEKGLNEEEIRILLETSTNEDGYLLLKKLERNTKNTFEFEEQVREIFPNAPKGQKKSYNLIQKFFKEYANKKDKIAQQFSRNENIKPANTLYYKFGGSYKCLECDDDVFMNEKDVLKHVQKHRARFIDTLVKESEEMNEYKTSPFVVKGLTSPRPLVMSKGKTREEIANESHAAKENAKALQERIKKLEAEVRSNSFLTMDQDGSPDNVDSIDDGNEDEDVDDDVDDANKENLPALALKPGDTVFRLERNSSLTANGKHATKLVANPNVRGGFVVSKAIIVEATGRHKKTPAKKTIIRNAEKVNDLSTELCRGTPGKKTILLGKVINKQSPEDVQEITSTNKSIAEANKISDEAAAALAIAGGLTQEQLRNMRRAGNNQNKRFLPSEVKLTKAKKSRLGVFSRDDYNVTDIPLQIRREGKDKKVLKLCPIVYVKNYKYFVKKVIKEELPDITPTLNGDGVPVIEIGFAADSGGGSMKFCMSIMNHKDRKVKLHVLLIYEAADTKLNNIRTFSLLTIQIKAMNDETLNIDGKMFKILQKGVFDYSAQDDLVGKQNSSSTFPCTKCTVTLTHLQNHANEEHSYQNCYAKLNIGKKSYKWYKDNLQEVVRSVALKQNNSPYDDLNPMDGETTSEMLQQSLEDRKGAAKKYGNVISVNLLEFSSIDYMVDPLLHILMGLCNDNLKFIRKDARELDKNNECLDELDQEKIDQVYRDINSKQAMELEYIENSREMKNMLERFKLVADGKIKEAEKEAEATYKRKAKKKNKRKECPTVHCLLFPVDIQEGYDRTIECENGCLPHTLCEGLHDFSEPILIDDEVYICNKCREVSLDGIKFIFEEAITCLDAKVRQAEIDVTAYLMEAKNLEQKLEENMGEHERMFTKGLKELHTEEQSYHGNIIY